GRYNIPLPPDTIPGHTHSQQFASAFEYIVAWRSNTGPAWAPLRSVDGYGAGARPCKLKLENHASVDRPSTGSNSSGIPIEKGAQIEACSDSGAKDLGSPG